MRKLKAILCIILLVVMFFGGIFLVVHFSKVDENKKVVVTTFPLYDICREILDSEEDILLLQDNGVDMHSYQPTTQDITAISDCELFVFIGGHSDDWVEGILQSVDNANRRELRLMDCVESLHESHDNIVSGDDLHDEDCEHEHHEDEYDEHIWLSVKNMKKMTEAVLEQLISVYPHLQQFLTNNADEYISKLDALDMQYAEVCENQSKTIVLADRFPFLYLAHDYGLNFMSAYSGCSSGGQDNADVKVELIQKINNEGISFIGILETSDGQLANSIVSECNHEVGILIFNSCQSIVSKDISIMNYLSIMERNLENLKKALDI